MGLSDYEGSRLARAGKQSLPTIKEAWDVIHSDEEEVPLLLSAHHSINHLLNNPDYSNLRRTVDPSILIQYAGDVDALYSLFETLTDEEEEDAKFNPNFVSTPASVMDNAFGEACEWNHRYTTEIDRQILHLGIDHRQLGCVMLTQGGKLVTSILPDQMDRTV